MGFSTLYLPDHFGEQPGPLTGLMAAADATTTLRVGPLVLDNDYRHPVVTAKEMATLDLLSDGRLEVGLGAGWMISDYDQSGIQYDSAGTRIERLG
jgi:alkanesulfonate monooxygenase SsuD/methylene tetrahydromethanopterin reductase-like flavin-dependent oxidoreductase (luciferase family)